MKFYIKNVIFMSKKRILYQKHKFFLLKNANFLQKVPFLTKSRNFSQSSLFSFEKMVAGMYLGELTRIVLEDLARQGILFGGDYEAISQRGCFPTKYLSEIER